MNMLHSVLHTDTFLLLLFTSFTFFFWAERRPTFPSIASMSLNDKGKQERATNNHVWPTGESILAPFVRLGLQVTDALWSIHLGPPPFPLTCSTHSLPCKPHIFFKLSQKQTSFLFRIGLDTPELSFIRQHMTIYYMASIRALLLEQARRETEATLPSFLPPSLF